jgi:hypothetical protein
MWKAPRESENLPDQLRKQCKYKLNYFLDFVTFDFSARLIIVSFPIGTDGIMHVSLFLSKKKFMKKTGLLSVLLVLFLGAFSQQTINDPNAEVRDVKGFHAIKVSSGIDLLITQGSTEAVAVSASNTDYRNRIITTVENGVLKISFKNDPFRSGSNKRLKAYVSFVKLDGLDVSSGASAKTDNEIKSPSFDLDVSSGATFDGKVNVTTLKVDQSSGSVVHISGAAGNADVSGNSGSVFHGYDLIADNCTAETNSGSGVQITVNKELSVDASSGGSISYKGSGVIKNIRTSSGGSVSKKS